MYKTCLLLGLLLIAAPAWSAPELSDEDQQRLADGTSDNDGMLDDQDGLYVLLRNASLWQGDDFSGDAGAAVAPPPDYDYVKENPEKVRGKTFLIEGWVAQHDRYPTKDNAGRDRLVRSGDPAWGDQVTRWTVVTGKGDAGKTIIVLFNDPRGQINKPADNGKVKIAARFLKLWTIPSASGTPFTYPVFVGGATEPIEEAADEGESPLRTFIIGMVLVGGLAFFVVRFMLAKRNGPNGSQLRQRLDEIRQHRERYEEEEADDEDEDEDLPEDPVQALDELKKRHDLPPDEL